MQFRFLATSFALLLGVAIPVAEARQGHDGNCGRDGDIGSRVSGAARTNYASVATSSADSAKSFTSFASSGYIAAGIATGEAEAVVNEAAAADATLNVY